MSENWWKTAKGTFVDNSTDLQDLLDNAGDKKLVVIDFFMQNCHYCKKFKDDWNRIVDEFTTEYGPEQIQFVKVDGIADYFSAARFDIESYPSFIAIEPGS